MVFHPCFHFPVWLSVIWRSKPFKHAQWIQRALGLDTIFLWMLFRPSFKKKLNQIMSRIFFTIETWLKVHKSKLGYFWRAMARRQLGLRASVSEENVRLNGDLKLHFKIRLNCNCRYDILSSCRSQLMCTPSNVTPSLWCDVTTMNQSLVA